jgi:glycosyltransferase involved in cell wall biosynthesis
MSNGTGSETGRADLAARDAPLVAIVTPVLNGAAFLADALEAVQAQTYPRLVHCVLDNASHDDTPAIIERYRNRRVPVIAARNESILPIFENWNAALRLVPEEAAYFRLLPADDLILPTCIEKMVAVAERHAEVAIVGCQEWVDRTLTCTDLPPDREVFDGRAVVRETLLKRMRGFPHLHCLYRLRADTDRGAFYGRSMHGSPILASDVDVAMRALATSAYGCVHEPLVVTRTHAGSVTSTVATPNGLQLWSDLQLIDSWGPQVFDRRRDYQRCRRRHLRFYHRKLLLWRLRGREELVRKHLDRLRAADALPTAPAWLASLADWPRAKAERLLARLPWWARPSRRRALSEGA